MAARSHPGFFAPQVSGIAYEQQPLEDLSLVEIITPGAPQQKIDYQNFRASLEARIEANRFQRAMPMDGAADTTIKGQPYVRGTLYLKTNSDTGAFRPLGFAYFVESALHHFIDPTIEQYISRPELYEENVLPFDAYETAWPLSLDIKKLPPSVINLIASKGLGESERFNRHKGQTFE